MRKLDITAVETGVVRVEDVERILAAVDLPLLVSRFVPLTFVNDHVGPCPLHQDTEHSLHVSGPRRVFRCLACGWAGDALDFLTGSQGYTFEEAVDWLARFAQVRVKPQRWMDPARRRLHELLELSAGYFSACLHATPEPLAYLTGRGLTQQTLLDFGIGWAPEAPSVVHAAAARGWQLQDLMATGLSYDNGADVFRSRIIYPVHDRRHRVVGFGARKLHDDQPGGKYVNSPNGPLYTKGCALFGAPEHRQAITAAGHAVVVEGYMDAMGLRQGGFLNVASIMGTAFSDRQLAELGLLTNTLLLAFDPDAAGADATETTAHRAAAAGFNVLTVPLPDGEDPADVVLSEGGRERWAELLSHAS